ncbi:DNA-processing protein DprA [Sandaracinobacteroides saxicola]|uniref:DNA-protecting protein DprA n=1 Tax=Sandaracinobacteroides saxicola TaxID=2759707 RepID=A0A7G5IGK5_9SPHN|nr:DNA-processing protein DprA [Sandaracinobacteroides saxicola]QMW22497.1 DNA-protecting protein DprA [Sandaracinobacteroides saxicola]
MSDADRIARVRLIRSENVGPVSFRMLLRRFGSAAAAVEALPDLARRGGRIASVAEAEAELAAIAAAGARALFLGDPDYPPLLAESEDAPPLLSALGDPVLAARPVVAMVGARNASAAAKLWAKTAARDLADAGFVVVSGMARGIDAAAHEGSLGGGTIAAIAGGIDIAYPPENAALQAAVAERGLLLAEMPPGTQPMARHFPRRNRIIAGIAQATVVVEAAVGSGSLITARLAGELGRDVLAVPGSPLDARARGCNALIKEGATLVEHAGDIVAALRPFGERLQEPKQPGFDFGGPIAEPGADAADRLRELLSPVPVPVDELVRQSGLPAADIQVLLVDLELEGVLTRHAGGRVSLV